MRSGPEVTPAPCKSISSGVLESDREQRWGGEVSLFWLLHDGHGKCCRYHSASGSSSHHWGPLLASPDGAVWGFGAMLTMAPLSLGKKLEGQALLPLAPGGLPFCQAGHSLMWPWNQLFLWNQPLCLMLGPGSGASQGKRPSRVLLLMDTILGTTVRPLSIPQQASRLEWEVGQGSS